MGKKVHSKLGLGQGGTSGGGGGVENGLVKRLAQAAQNQ